MPHKSDWLIISDSQDLFKATSLRKCTLFNGSDEKLPAQKQKGAAAIIPDLSASVFINNYGNKSLAKRIKEACK